MIGSAEPPFIDSGETSEVDTRGTPWVDPWETLLFDVGEAPGVDFGDSGEIPRVDSEEEAPGIDFGEILGSISERGINPIFGEKCRVGFEETARVDSGEEAYGVGRFRGGNFGLLVAWGDR